MKVGFLGAGTWGTALANLIASNNHGIIVWDRNSNLINDLKNNKKHPKLKDFRPHSDIYYTNNLLEAIEEVDLIVESVTSLGIREVFEAIVSKTNIKVPVVITSKGLEQKTDLLLFEVLKEIIKDINLIGVLSGPSHAEEVIKNLPTSVVCSSYSQDTLDLMSEAFNSPYFRVYPNPDIVGVSFGGAMKNVIAIACAISDGLGFGDNTKAALMTRGLHEMKRLSIAKKANPQTLNGLSGMGDLCVTCLSNFSRNYRFGRLIAKGLNIEQAKKEIGMVVEGVYSCVAALDLAKKNDIEIPITEAVYAVLYENLPAKNVVKLLMQRKIKEELSS